MIGGDSITFGDRTVTVEELAAQAQAALTAFLQTPEGAIRAAQQILHGTLDIVLTIIVTFYLLLDGARFRDVAAALPRPAGPGGADPGRAGGSTAWSGAGCAASSSSSRSWRSS